MGGFIIDDRLTDRIREHIQANEEEGLGVSVISCWEVARKIQERHMQSVQISDDVAFLPIYFPLGFANKSSIARCFTGAGSCLVV